MRVMRHSWMVGRAVPCPPHDKSTVFVARPVHCGGQRTARPTNSFAAVTEALQLRAGIRL